MYNPEFRPISCILKTQVLQAIDEARQKHFQLRDGKWTILPGRVEGAGGELHSVAVAAIEKDIKHHCIPDNAYLRLLMGRFNPFLGTPECELHNRILGTFGHMLLAFHYAYYSVLRRPDLVTVRGHPLVSDGRLGLHLSRLKRRLLSLDPNETSVIISSGLVAQFDRVYLNQESGAKLTGERHKRLMVVLGILYRDLIATEVRF